MGVALIAWGRFFDQWGNRITVPAPSTTPGAPWLYDFLAGEVGALSAVGFSAIQLPPVSKAQGGAGSGCDGYGVFDRRDIGSKNQQGSRPTRYGDADSLRRCIASAHAVGLDVYLDVVLHQLIGENGGTGVFRYLGADGQPGIGRGAMNPGCFRGIPPADRPEDAVPVPFYDFAFGDELVYQNCDPPGYTIEDALDYGDWLFRTTGADGGRLDDVKGIYAPFVSQFMRSRAMADKFFYSEYFDGDPGALNWWATSSPMFSRSLVADFTLHFALRAACNGGNASALNGAGYLTWNPYLACTFVDNPDTDTSFGEAVVSSKLLGYAYMLSAEGYPFVYGKDYFTGDVWPGAYGLKPWIDNLIWIHETLAAGPTVNRWIDGKVIVLNRTGWPGLLTALNFDTWNVREITCDTAFGPNAQLHDYTGRHPDIWTDGQGQATFRIPSNAFQDGQSYLCFSRPGFGAPVSRPPRRTTQTFFGAVDLDTAPATPGRSVQATRIWCRAGTPLRAELVAIPRDGMQTQDVSFAIHSPSGATRAAGSAHAEGVAGTTGWHKLSVEAATSAMGSASYELTVEYAGTPDGIG
jgi:alpha-amylase